MALYRQSGTERYGARGNHDLHHHHYANGTSSSSSDHIAIGIRANGGTSQHSKATRVRRLARPDKSRRFNVASVLVVLSFVLAVTVLAYYCISGYGNNDINNNDKKETNSYHAEDDDLKNDTDFLTNVTRTTTFKVLGFGHGSVSHGRDSRYWDRDDRRRDDDYNEDAVENTSKASEDGSLKKDHVSLEVKNKNKKTSLDDSHEGTDQRGVGLYNEAGRNELKKYEAEYEASMKNGVQSRNEYDNGHQILDGNNFGVHHEAVEDDVDYEDAIDSHDFRKEEYDDAGHDQRGHSDIAKLQKNSDFHLVGTKDQNIAKEADKTVSNREESSSAFGDFGGLDVNSRVLKFTSGQSMKISKSDPKKRSKRRKFSGSSCEMKFLNSTAQLVEPLESRKFARFSLQYSEVEEKPDWEEAWKPRFAGHQSLQEREESFLAHDQKINCGFVKGPKGSQSTGFDLSEDDENYISRCHIAVISCIFGNSDRLRTPAGKTVSRLSRKNVCFVMFMDEVTLQTLASEGQSPDRTGFIGLWKIVVVRNLPYEDMRRVGKIPKLLPHRLFPSARYSIWLDSKLRLQLDPLLILEYFLWRKGHEYAISNHYDRHCVWEEVAQNKKLNKYNPTVIDQQFAFYQADGLTRFNASDPNKLLPSNVPEGSFIVRAHTPMSNLFSCLWFNEVDRFTSRDQLSFAYTYQKLRRMNPEKPFYLHMFKDCERRAIAKLFRHRSDEKRNVYQQAIE